MPLNIDELVSQFEQINEQFVIPTKDVLSRCVAYKPLHARLLNTLSMLEHLGSHKIMATQHGQAIDQPTLKHLADETRHAFFFKRHADREAGRTMNYDADDLIAPASARLYFQRLETEIVRTFPPNTHPRAIYLTTSMIVEFRAIWGYRLYQAVLTHANHTLSLKGLLAEEGSHLTDMASRLDELGELDERRLRQLIAVEQRLYQRLLLALNSTIETRQAA
jgi:hypothetical protein